MKQLTTQQLEDLKEELVALQTMVDTIYEGNMQIDSGEFSDPHPHEYEATELDKIMTKYGLTVAEIDEVIYSLNSDGGMPL